MKYYIIAGEASGDLHASNLMKEIMQRDAQAEFRFWGGDLMQAVGGKMVKHYKDLAFMGFTEVIMNLRTILGNIKICKKDLQAYQPDVLILVDYPGFNLRIAQYARQNLQAKIAYYISPQIWAWKEGRVHGIKKNVDEMLLILPFEKDFYAKHHYNTHFVGHPLLDAIAKRTKSNPREFRQKWGLPDGKIVALLPGSRKQEIEKMLHIMLSVREDFADYSFVIAGAPSQERSFYERIMPDGVFLVQNDTYSLLENSHAAMVTSGTATLETALFGVPEVVCYTGSAISYAIAKQLVKNIEYISLVNLIMDREVVTELIQSQLNTKNLGVELTKLLEPANRERFAAEYSALRNKLGGEGASQRAAKLIVDLGQRL